MTLTIDKVYNIDNKLTGVLIKIPPQDPQLTVGEVISNIHVYIDYPRIVYYYMDNIKKELCILAFVEYIVLPDNNNLLRWDRLAITDLLSKHK